MNRTQKRDFVKKLKKKGINEKVATVYADFISTRDGGSGAYSNPQNIAEGERVKLNVTNIKARKHYENMSEKYKEFVEASEDKEYTARVERENLISLAEEPQWLFWSGDLIKVVSNVSAVDDICINVSSEGV